jgi:predicted O-methyltransferase YrrM
MLEKLKTALWFLRNPPFWAQAIELARRKLTGADRHEAWRRQATDWAAERAVSAQEALERVGIYQPTVDPFPQLPETLVEDAERRADTAQVAMGGPGDLGLLYAAVALTKPRSVIETGVAYGWSSLAILAAMKEMGGRLISVDMPYAKMNNEPWVGVAVPDALRANWTLIREPDRNGLEKAIAAAGGRIQLCHYDSDKSYPGRQYAYPLLWKALEPGGLFISDDIQDNFAFRDFCKENGLDFQVTESAGKFVGLVRKPPA